MDGTKTPTNIVIPQNSAFNTPSLVSSPVEQLPTPTDLETARPSISVRLVKCCWPKVESTDGNDSELSDEELATSADALIGAMSNDGEEMDSADDEKPRLTDEEILSGDISLLDGANLLQVASSLRNKEIVANVNARYAKPMITEPLISSRLNRALTRAAASSQRTRAEVKKEFQEARKAGDVYKRGVASRIVASKITKQANKRKLSTIPEEDEPEQPPRKRRTVEDMKISNLLETPEPIETPAEATLPPKTPAVDTDDDAALISLRAECEIILQEDPDLLFNDRMLKAASVFTNSEIVDKVKAVHEDANLCTRLVSERIHRALKFVSGRDGKPRAEVKAELDAARREYGTRKRMDAYSGAMRKAAHLKKKAAAKPVVLADADVNMVDVEDEEGEDQEDPLGDLEEIIRQANGGTLSGNEDRTGGAEKEHEDGEVHGKSGPQEDGAGEKEHEMEEVQVEGGVEENDKPAAESPRPFDDKPVRYLAGHPFRTYEEDGRRF
ncbi:hypothetical protein LTR37_014473 [Vermiconidia calcicola]|uniref:Uncharacterized protein n=1 Tax=Vermiconidia calcicola TaxID=1690605 RepID=A0ACC3MU41_9PEZI|nr:hypothetical protein LTR37_014473 [Vermiconidia calcicola]